MKKFSLVPFLALLPFFCQAQKDNNCQASKKPLSSLYYNSENLPSDTFDILKYSINLEVGSTSNAQIWGHTRIRFAPKMNNRQ